MIPCALASEVHHVADREALTLAVIVRIRTKRTGDQVDAGLLDIAPHVFSIHDVARRHTVADTDVDGSAARLGQASHLCVALIQAGLADDSDRPRASPPP